MHSIKFENGEEEYFETNKELKEFLFLLKGEDFKSDFNPVSEIYIDINIASTLNDYISILKMKNPEIEIPNEIKTIEEMIEFFDIIDFYRKIKDLSY